MTAVEARVLEELRSRRERLAAVGAAEGQGEVVDLLRRVDATLARLESPEWGECTVCHERIRPASPFEDLVRVCLECLSPEERSGLERDLEKAAGVQQALLPPRELIHDGWEVSWHWEPRGAVSGDHVDLLVPRCEEDVLHLLLGDVVGKGVSASLLQSHLHALFRGLAAADLSLDGLMSRANRVFSEATAAASYATLLAARLHRDGTLELANAGHPRPLLADHRGVRPVEGSGLPLGLFPNSEYSPRCLHLAPGDTMLLYTDGLTEAESRHGEYGIGRAAAALRRVADRPLSELIAACRADVEAFLEGGRNSDDLTLLAIRRPGRD